MASITASAPANVAAAGSSFRLLRFFTLASLTAFALVGAALLWQEHSQDTFFRGVQESQNRFFGQVQDGFVKQQADAARHGVGRRVDRGIHSFVSQGGHFASAAISIAPHGHSCSHSPQPLQKS